MIDIKFLRENPDVVKENIKKDTGEFLNKLGFDKNKPSGDGNRSARLFGIVKE